MKQAIALAGGGTKGAYQVGAWKAMRELGIPFDIVTGTSIGSVTAALMVQDDFDRAWELWTHITEEQIMLERDDATPHEKRELAALAEHPEQLIARCCGREKAPEDDLSSGAFHSELTFCTRCV